MTKIQDFAFHSERLQQMAATLGVDLGQAVLTDKLDTFPFQDMVYRCSKCHEVLACEHWLAAHESGAADAPDYCRNKYVLEALQPAAEPEPML